MKKTLALFFCTLLCAASVQAAPSKAEELIAKGSALVQKKDYKGAAKQFELALAAKPGDPKIQSLLGLTYAQIGDLNKAVEYSQASVAKEPSYTAYNNLGIVFANRAEFGKAKNAYEAALAISPNAYRTWYQLGLVHVQSGDFAKGIECYERSIAANKKFASAYLGLGTAYFWSGKPAKAREQVGIMKEAGFSMEASQLEAWLDKKEKTPQAPAAPAAPKQPEPSSK